MKAAELQIAGTLKLLFNDVSEGGCIVTLTYDRFSVTARGEDMAYTLPGDKQVEVKVSYVDANGNPAAVDGEVSWESSDTDIADVEVDASDSTHATIVPGTKVGQAQISANADADLGAGIRNLITTMDLTVVGGEAVAGTIEPVGAPTPKP
jgi:hypothetical protein